MCVGEGGQALGVDQKVRDKPLQWTGKCWNKLISQRSESGGGGAALEVYQKCVGRGAENGG